MKNNVYSAQRHPVNSISNTSSRLLCRYCLLLLGLIFLTAQAQAQISGTVYRDFNANGIRDNTNELGVGGITVTAYSGTIAVGSTITSSGTTNPGQYTLTASGTGPYRIQFTNLPAGYFAGPKGTGSGTTVQFVATPAATGISLGINYPDDYCQTDPNFLVPCYVNGSPTSTTGNTAAQPVLVGLPYSSTSPTASGGNTATEGTVAINSQIGTVYGLAYQRAGGYGFSSAFIKRHSGLGPSGAGAIYITRTTGSSLFVNIPNVGTVADNAGRGLPGNTTDLNRDPTVYDQVGKAGLGDMEISEDGTQLYVVNLNNQQLYRVPINNPTTNPTAGTPVGFALPAVTQRQGSVFRPFALKVYRGRVYVGGITTNEAVPTSTTVNFGSGTTPGNLITRDTTQMKAVVFEFNPTTNTFATTPVLSFPLTYKRGAINNDKSGVDRAEYWYPWTEIEPGITATSIPSRFARNDAPNVSYPQPWFTGIDFDVNGSMIIGLRDRCGDQWGNSNLGPNASTGTRVYRTNAAGDILRAGKCSPTANLWTLENNARTCIDAATAGAGNGQGPGNGEYYYTDFTQQGPPYHNEIANGAVIVLPGRGEVATTAVDPTYDTDAGGIRRFNNVTGVGTPATSVQIYVSGNIGTFGKANGLGDIELTCNVEPIEIGNRLFNDGDFLTADGIQGNGNAGSNVAGATVMLYRVGNATPVASTTTNAAGEYYFNSTNVTGGLLPNTAYEIRVALNQSIFTTPVTVTRNNVGRTIPLTPTASCRRLPGYQPP